MSAYTTFPINTKQGRAKKKALFGVLLAVVLVAGALLPINDAHSEAPSCPNHLAHDELCGYAEAVEGHPCAHEHTEACYSAVSQCPYEHAEEGQFSAEEIAEHIHSAECFVQELNCQHVHDAECGYAEARDAQPCQHTCELCDALQEQSQQGTPLLLQGGLEASGFEEMGLLGDGDNSTYWLDLRWVGTDPSQEQDREATTKSLTYMAKYALTVSTNNVEYEAGQMEIRIPGKLWDYRDGTVMVPASFGFPKAPNESDTVPFNYTIDNTDPLNPEVVIKNYRKVEGSSNYVMQIEYALDCVKTIDRSQGYIQAVATATHNGPGAVAETKTSQAISLKLNTFVGLKRLVRSGTLLYYWDEQFWGIPKPADFNDYRWVQYSIQAEYDNGTVQPFHYLLEVAARNGGVVLDLPQMPTNTLPGFGIVSLTDGVAQSRTFTASGYAGSVVDFNHFFVVRYPAGSEGDLLGVDITVTAVGEDGYQNPSLSTNLDVTWNDYHFQYFADTIAVSKSMAGYTALENSRKEGVLSALKNGADADTDLYHIAVQVFDDVTPFEVELYDDFLDWQAPDGTMVQMTPDDYYFKMIELYNIDLYQFDRATGQKIYYTQGDPTAPKIEIWALTKGASDYVKVSERLLSDMIYKKSDGTISSTWGWYSPEDPNMGTLPANTYRFKIKTSGEFAGYCKIHVYAKATLRGDSPTLKSWLQANPGMDSLLVRNFDAAKLYSNGVWRNIPGIESYDDSTASFTGAYSQHIIDRDIATYGDYVQRGTASCTMLGMQPNARLEISQGGYKNDLENRRVNTRYTLVSYEGDLLSGLSSEAIQTLKNNNYPALNRDEGLYYVLLPLGTYFDQKGIYDASDSTNRPADCNVQLIDDYHGTGRQMVIFRVKTRTPGANYTWGNFWYKRYSSVYGSYSTSGPGYSGIYSGFSVRFDAYVPWENVNVATNAVVLTAYQLPDKSAIYGDKGYTDACDAYVSTQHAQVKDSEGRPSFYNVRGDGVDDVKDTIFSYCTQLMSVPMNMATGLHKDVRRTDTQPFGDYGTDTAVKLGGTYEYRLYLQNSVNSYLEDVILFDKLEQGANRDGNTGEDAGWKGTFVSVNTLYARALGIKPVVYYSTAPNPQYFTVADIASNAVAGMGWSTTPPGDLSTVTGIAVDLSKDTNGNPFRFDREMGTSVMINMQAPDVLTDARYCYNYAAYYSKFVPATMESPRTETNESMRTRLEMLYDPTILKEASPAAGETESNATLLSPGEVVTYTIQFDPGKWGQHSIAVKDVIPEGMSLVKGSIWYKPKGQSTIMLNGAAEASAYNASTREITWPVFDVVNGGVSEFSFQAMVQKLPANEMYKLYKNEARISVDGEEALKTNATYHAQYRRSVSVEKTAALVEGVKFSDANAATGGTLKPEEKGTIALPVVTAQEQLVEYHIVARNAGGTGKSGQVTVLDSIPGGTTFVPGSMTCTFRSTANPTQPVVGSTATVTPTTTTTSGGTVVDLIWTLNSLANGEEAYLTFRVKAPSFTTVFINSAIVTDAELAEQRYPATVVTYDGSGFDKYYIATTNVYDQSEYKPRSDYTYHRVPDMRIYKLRIVKQLKNAQGQPQAAMQDEQFVFTISTTIPDGNGTKSITFYQVVTVKKGQTEAYIDVVKLLPGSYTITEQDTNWRYTVSGAATQTQTLSDETKMYTYTFTNVKTNDKWVSDKASVTNIMPQLPQVPR